MQCLSSAVYQALHAGALRGPLGVQAGLGDEGALVSKLSEGDSCCCSQVVVTVALIICSSRGWKTGLRTSPIVNAGGGDLHQMSQDSLGGFYRLGGGGYTPLSSSGTDQTSR